MNEDVITPSDKFYQEFGEGTIPIKYAFGWAECGSAPEWLDRMHSALDILDSLTIDLDRLFELSHQYRELQYQEPQGLEESNDAPATQRDARLLVQEMMRGGLTLRQIARWLEVPESEVAWLACWRRRDADELAALLDVDDWLWAETRSGYLSSNAEIERKTGVGRNVVSRLRAMRSAA